MKQILAFLRPTLVKVVLRMAEITLIEALASDQVIVEAERNLEEKLPEALPSFRLVVDRCLTLVPTPGHQDLARYRGLADAKDLPILVAALQSDCDWLVTFNGRHFQPGHPDLTGLRPGAFLMRIRDLLTYLT